MDDKVFSSLLEGKRDFQTKTSLEALTNKLRHAFLDQWSETPDNIETSRFLQYGHIKDEETGELRQGLVLTNHSELLSTIFWTAFGDSTIPKEVQRRYPNMKQTEWNQVLRVAQLVLTSLECSQEKDAED